MSVQVGALPAEHVKVAASESGDVRADQPDPRRSVGTLVIGGGIAGLACAFELRKAGADVLLIDAGEQPGGVMQTRRRNGFLLEQGPFNVLVRTGEFAQLIADVADEAELISVSAAAKENRYVLHAGRLQRVPMSAGQLAGTSLISSRGKLRLLGGLLWSKRGRSDASIDEVMRRRFGIEVAERLASAVTIGTMAAESHELECASALPALAMVDGGLSPLLSLVRMRVGQMGGGRRVRPNRDIPRGMVGFRGGLGGFAGVLAKRLGDAVKLRTRVVGIERAADGGFLVDAVQGGQRMQLRAQQVVLAIGARGGGELLTPLHAELGEELRGIDHVSLTVLNIAFDRSAVGHPLDGYGFLVPHASRGCPLLGVLWASSVFRHHAPADQVLMRVFVGGSRHRDLANAPDDVLLATVMDALGPLLGIRGEPTLVDVCRWVDAVPIYRPGHLRRMERIRLAQRPIAGLHLAGNYLDGVSVNSCATRGVRIAQQILQEIRS